MIKGFIKFIFILAIFLGSLLVFLPKENLYYLALDMLKKEKVVVLNSNIEDKYYKFILSNTNIFYQKINIAKIKHLNIQTYLLSSKIEISNIVLDDIAKQFLPSKIKFVQISHSILKPLEIYIKANSIQAKAYGSINLQNRKVLLNIIPSKQFIRSYGKILKKMKKMKNGEYRFEYKL
jgi:hypothetical protein